MPSIKGKSRGSDLRNARLGYGASFRAVARYAGVSPSTVIRWEGIEFLHLAPTVALRRIAKVLRVRLFYRRRQSKGSVHGVPDLVFTFPSSCKAKTRTGQPCKKRPTPGRWRCRLHGGLSTGPKTEEGRARCKAAALEAWARRRQAKEGVVGADCSVEAIPGRASSQVFPTGSSEGGANERNAP